MPLEVSENIIQAVRLGDRNAFAQLVDRSGNFVYAVALKMLGNKQDAEDLAQDCFIKVWEKIGMYNTQYKFGTWLYRIVINASLDRLRKRKHDGNPLGSESQNEMLISSHLLSDQQFEERDFIEFVRILSGRLSHKQHAVFVLHDLDELEQDEISEILDMSKGSVKSNLHLARKALRKLLTAEEEQKTTNNDEL